MMPRVLGRLAAALLPDPVASAERREVDARAALTIVSAEREAIDAELGELLAGAHPGRTSPSEITVFGGVGLAFQDLVVAWEVYRLAGALRAGRPVDFLA